MKLQSLLMITPLCVLAIVSCKKDPPVAVPGTTEVEITFQSPESSTTVSISEEIHIEGIIDANALMGGWKIFASSENGDTIAFYEDHFEQTQYIFHYHWFPTPQETGTVTIQVEALDVNFNSLATKEIQILCQ